MSRIFLSHSSKDVREAVALKRWLAEQDATLADEIFLDVEGLLPGLRWRDALRQAHARCEAVICLLSKNWEDSHECRAEYRTAENLNKQILCARLESCAGESIISEWQRCDLFGDGPKTAVDIGDGAPVRFATHGLLRLKEAIGEAGIGPESFPWPPANDPDRAPYRGWQPLEQVDAAVFFGRDAAIVRALDAVRGMRLSGVKSLFVVLGPSGSGKSSFLRAGLLPRLAREDRRFVLLDIVRPGRNALTGETGLAHAICTTRQRMALPTVSLGQIKTACTAGDTQRISQWLNEIRHEAAMQLLEDLQADDAPPPPTLIVPLDQAEELFSADAGPQAEQFLTLVRELSSALGATESEIGLIVTATIRTDRYEVMQTAPALAGVETLVFDELKPMPLAQFTEVITGPARRSTQASNALRVAPDLVERLLNDAAEGADTLPMLSLTLSRLYADYGSSGELTVEQYESMGAMREVVQNEIDDVLAAEPDRRQEQLATLRTAFIPWLATVNPDNDQPMRRVARYSDLPEASRPLIDALVAKRLMVKDTREGECVVEVALESLLRQWEELAGWLRDERRQLKAADDLERAAMAWRASDHDVSWLLTGTRLTDAEALVAKAGFRQRLASANDYLVASRDSENEHLRAEEEHREAELRNAKERQVTAEAHAATLRKRSRVLRAVLAVTVVVAVAAVVAFGFAMHARGQAEARFREAMSVRPVSEAQGMLDGNLPGGDARAIKQLLAGDALSPGSFDGVLLAATVKCFNTIKIIETGVPIVGMVLSPDGRRMVSGGEDGMLRTLDAQTGNQVEPTFTGHEGWVNAVAYSPDGRRLVSAGDDRTVRVWNAETGQPIGEPLRGHTDEVWSVAFSPDGHTVASAGVDTTVRLWNADTGQAIGTPLTGHTESVMSLAFSPDGHRLASSGSDNSVRLWDVGTGAQIREPFATYQDQVQAVAFSPDGRKIAAGGSEGIVQIWDAQTAAPIGGPLVGQQSSVNSVAFSPSGRWIAAGGEDGAVRLWDANSGQPWGEPLEGHQETVWTVQFSPDSGRLVSSSLDGTVRVWDLGIGEPLIGHTGRVFDVFYSPDGTRIASAGEDKSVRLWDPETGRQIALIPYEQSVLSVAFAPDSTRLASAGRAGALRVWDARTGNPIGASIATGQNLLTSVAFTPDGQRIVTGGGNSVRIWDAASGQAVGAPMIHDELVRAIAISPDGRRIVSAGVEGANFGRLKLWDAAAGQLIAETQRDNGIRGLRGLAFSPDGRYVEFAGTEGTLTLADASTLEPLDRPFEGHWDSVRGLAFSPDGHMIASASEDKTIRLWNADTGLQITDALTGHSSAVNSVAFSPDGRRIVSSGDDGTVRLWPATARREDLCAKLTTNMSREQWDDWVSPDIDYVKVCPDLPIAGE